MTIFTPRELNTIAREGKSALERIDLEFEANLLSAARTIARTADTCPIILLAGPSGSGKTTTARKLEGYLDNMGVEAYTVPMDNYFYRRADGFMPRDEEGKVDYESPLNLDMELFFAHTRMMAEGKEVDMPTFDFVNQRRAEQTVPVKRKKGEIIIFEGIHALNPQVMPDHSFSRRVYICPDAAVKMGEHTVTEQNIRLLRRLMRDRIHRGSSFEDTLRKFRSVCRGERLFIDPYKDTADIFVSTFLPYELNVYSPLLTCELENADRTLMEQTACDKALGLLKMLEPIDVNAVSPNALIQEFLGR